MFNLVHRFLKVRKKIICITLQCYLIHERSLIKTFDSKEFVTREKGEKLGSYAER